MKSERALSMPLTPAWPPQQKRERKRDPSSRSRDAPALKAPASAATGQDH